MQAQTQVQVQAEAEVEAGVQQVLVTRRHRFCEIALQKPL
jgi:hypothetical protein